MSSKNDDKYWYDGTEISEPRNIISIYVRERCNIVN